MFRDTITLFNRRRAAGDDEDMWYPTVMEGVDLQADEAAVTAKYSFHRGDKALVLIHYTGPPEHPEASGKRYLPPKVWQKAEDPAGAFTFQTGEVFDFFIEGAWEGVELGPVRDADWPRGFYDHMNRTRDGVWAITAASKYSIIKHFEVTGK